MTGNSDSQSDEDAPDEEKKPSENPSGDIEKADTGSPALPPPEELIAYLAQFLQQGASGTSFEYRYQRSAPLPTPEELKEYGKILPSAPERIMRMAENASEATIEGEHRRDNLVRSLMVGVPVIVVGCLAFASYLAHLGHNVTGMITALGSTFGYIISIFGRRLLRRKDREDSD